MAARPLIEAVGDYIERAGIAKTINYYQANAPSDAADGEIWAKTDSEEEQFYVFDNGTWRPLAPDEAVLALEVMPARPVTIVTVVDTGGWAPDTDTPALEPTCQVRTRGPTFQVAHDLSWDVFDLLHGKNDLPLGADYRVLSCFGIQSPMSMGRNDDGNSEFSVNFEFRLYRLG